MNQQQQHEQYFSAADEDYEPTYQGKKQYQLDFQC